MNKLQLVMLLVALMSIVGCANDTPAVSDDTANDTTDDDLVNDDDSVIDDDTTLDDDLDDDMIDDDTLPPAIPGCDDPATCCPAGMIYFSGGAYTIVYEASRHGIPNHEEVQVTLDEFCLASTQATQPTAATNWPGDFQGQYGEQFIVPPAQYGDWAKGKIPWSGMTWWEAQAACIQQDGRLALREELWVAMTHGRKENVWGYGGLTDPITSQVVPDGQWSDGLGAQSWTFVVPDDQRPRYDRQGRPLSVLPNGGPDGWSDYGFGVYDLLGDESKATGSPWDFPCYGFQFGYFGGGSRTPIDRPNIEIEDADHPGCWLFTDYALSALSWHFHHWPLTDRPTDDGFICAAQPYQNGYWSHVANRTEPDPDFYPPVLFFYDRETGEKKYYRMPSQPDGAEQFELIEK